MSKNILYLGGFELPDKNAAAQRVMANAKLLKELGFKVSFIGISKDIGNEPKLVGGFDNKPIPYPATTLQWLHHIFIYVKISEILKYNPDYVVLYNFPAIASLHILSKCHKYGIKVIQDITEWESNNGWSLSNIARRIDINLRMHYCLKKMDGLVAISNYLYNYYKKYTKTILVPPTIDLTDPKFCRDRLLTSSDSITRLVYAGSVGKSATKDRLDIIIKVVNSLPNVKFNIIGLTKDQYLRIFGKDCKIYDNVVFHGRVSHKEAVKYVCESDFQILVREKTLKNTAGFPTKFVESMSCCIPLIANLTSDIGNYIKDGVNGWVVSNEHPLDEVIEKVSKMSAAEKIKMKEACKSFKGFDYHYYRNEFEKIFI